jgi:transcriptional regulator with XRE-family HTH domain
MKKQKKQETAALPPLCAAVKRIRESYGESQPEFAQRVQLAPMTISKFERGATVPADSGVLIRLARVAREKGLKEETDLLEHIAVAARGVEFRDARAESDLVTRLQPIPVYSLPQWRLMAAAGIAALYYPEAALAIERAAGEALALVDEAIRQCPKEPVSPGLGFANQLARLVMTLAEERALERFKQKEE